MPDRPPIPRPLEREVLVEAGHRCAIPTCRSVPVEIAHIVPWNKVKEHTFDNLIALCPTCHTRYDKGDIDRQSMLRYKANLSVLGGRYGDVEQRVLQSFAENENADTIVLPALFDVLLMNLLKDGMLVNGGSGGAVISVGGINSSPVYYRLTPNGRQFIHRWLAAEPLE